MNPSSKKDWIFFSICDIIYAIIPNPQTKKIELMKLKFYATFRNVVGQKEIKKEFAGTVSDLLWLLCDEYGETFKDAVFDEKEKPRKYVKIFVNGRNIEDLNGIETMLKNEDTVAILPPIAGG